MAPILEIDGLTKRFGGVAAVNRVSLSLEPGRIYGLIGPNGSGKTTLFNCITGVETRDEGAIRFRGQRIDGLAPHRIFHLGMGRTFQIIRVFPELTALENLLVVTTTPFVRGAGARARAAALRQARAARRRVRGQPLLWPAEARGIRARPHDRSRADPARRARGGVNRTLLNELLSAVRTLRDAGKTVFLVEHDMKVVMGLCETVFVLDHGEKLIEGPPGLIQADERVIEAYFGR
mgnify:CR=1 FL=1